MTANGFLWADIEGLSLTPEDREILAHPAVSGIILFSRNYENPAQLRALNADIQKTFPHLIITVDQEGGRVQRFREGFTELPSMESWGKRYLEDAQQAEKDFGYFLSIMIRELKNNGVYSSLVPVLDINYGHNQVIGHRSFGASAETVIAVADVMITRSHELNMPVMGKHFPGHGFVSADSHLELPIDDRVASMIMQDMRPFGALAAKMDAIMLAHVVYTQIDPNPVCFSPFWIQEILRKQLQFNGLIVTDDLSMEAVGKMGSYGDRAKQALAAGCDILLVCNARAGVVDILDNVPFSPSSMRAARLAHYRRFH